VPLVISSVKTALNIILDLLFLSKYRVGRIDVDVNTQAVIRLLCDALGALAGLGYFLWIAGLLSALRRKIPGLASDPPLPDSSAYNPTLSALKLVGKPGSYTFAESALRNALYLWLVSGIVGMGPDWANVTPPSLPYPSPSPI
jgi:hypothetical protein